MFIDKIKCSINQIAFNVVSFLKLEQGVMAIVFVLLLPVYFAFYALVIDGVLIFNKRVRLADGLNEAVLMISAVDNRNTDAQALLTNQNIVKNFLSIYVPDAEYDNDKTEIQVEEGSSVKTDTQQLVSYVDYKVFSEVIIHTLLPVGGAGITGFDESVSITNDRSHSGMSRKYDSYTPVDFVFVVDFSRSMSEEVMEDVTSGTQEKRIEVLKKVVNQVIEKGLEVPNTKFAIVPFDIGVPEKSDNTNESGGKEIICSVQFVPKTDYKIDYAFWANKFVDTSRSSFTSDTNKILYYMDDARMRYYWDIFLVSRPELDDDIYQLINSTYNFCTANKTYGLSYGRAKYSCERSSDESIFSSYNYNLIASEYSKVINNLLFMRIDKQSSYGLASFANVETVDIEETMDKMFDESNITRFVRPWTPNIYEYGMFSEMCQSGMGNNLITPTVEVIREEDYYGNDEEITLTEANNAMAQSMSTADAATYVIPLTRDKDTLNQFSDMVPNGGTDIISGILRALPVLVEGENPNKVLVLVSDGEDMNGPQKLADAFLESHLCDRIKEDIKDKTTPETQQLKMYYISVSSNDVNDARLLYWEENCVGEGYALTADSYDDMMSIFTKIVEVETGFFIN